MNIAIVGYGKMGKIIEEVALSRGHSVDVKIDLNNLHEFNANTFAHVDAACCMRLHGLAGTATGGDNNLQQ